MKHFSPAVRRATRAAMLVLALAAASPLSATNLTGTFKHPDGSPVNGKLIFLLSQPARLSDGTAQVVPMVKIFAVTNGALEAGAFVYGNDALLPSGTYYLVRLVDNSNNLLFEQKWSIQGTNLDLGTLTPTTTGVVLPDPLIKNVPTEQSVQGPVSFSSPVTAFSLTLNGNLNPGTASSYDLGSDALPWRTLVVDDLRARKGPWYDVRAYGAVGDNNTNDLAAFQSAINACATSGAGKAGGTVYAAKAASYYYHLNGALTFPAPAVGSYCTLLLEGGIKTNATLSLPPEGWNIEGACGTNNGAPSFIHNGCTTVIAQTGTQNPMLKIGDGVSAVARVHIKNVSITNNYGDAVVVEGKGGGNITFDGVFLQAGSTANGHALLIKDSLQAYVRNSVLGGPQAEGTIGTFYAIRLTGTTAGQNVGSLTIKDSTFVSRGVKVDRQAGPGASMGNVYMERVLFESYQDSLVVADTTNAPFQYLTCIQCEMADLAYGNPAMFKFSGAYPINDILVLGSVQPTGGWFDDSGLASTAGPVTVWSGSNGSMYLGKDSIATSAIADGGISGRVVHALSGPDTQAVNLLGGVVQVNMATPTGLTAASGGGGSLADGTYYYVVTALNGTNAPCDNKWVSCYTPYQTWVSEEVSCAISGGGGAGSCALNWTDVPGATSYRIYGRGAYAYGVQNKTLYFTSTTSDFTDTGAAGTAGAVPTYNRESGNAPIVRFVARPDKTGVPAQHFVGAGNLGIGTYTPGAPLDVVGKIRTTTQVESTASTGTAPLVVASTTKVSNLNVQMWENKDALDFSSSLDFGAIAAQTCSELTITVTGAAANNPVAPSWPAALEAGLAGMMFVSAADTVKVRLCNVTSVAIDPASATFAGRVIK